jgi:hypothetical protein
MKILKSNEDQIVSASHSPKNLKTLLDDFNADKVVRHSMMRLLAVR